VGAREHSQLREQEDKPTGLRVLVRGQVWPSRVRMWRELADVFETFLVGACGRALPADAQKGPPRAPESPESDEMLEALALDALCNEALAKCADAPRDVQQRLVEVVERCAARTSELSLESALWAAPTARASPSAASPASRDHRVRPPPTLHFSFLALGVEGPGCCKQEVCSASSTV